MCQIRSTGVCVATLTRTHTSQVLSQNSAPPPSRMIHTKVPRRVRWARQRRLSRQGATAGRCRPGDSRGPSTSWVRLRGSVHSANFACGTAPREQDPTKPKPPTSVTSAATITSSASRSTTQRLHQSLNSRNRRNRPFWGCFVCKNCTSRTPTALKLRTLPL